MSRQDKATTERNARILRDLVKQPDNKACADCRKNDARWASWNLGVFLCIRCSGIHRSMGTHISKVKSIDLDIWTPEQMESIQKWGNRLANLYWEKHLKAGHNPPDHKIESFIRSKYESRRWAMEGPPPRDPRVLESGNDAHSAAPRPTTTSSAAPPAPAPLPKTHPLLSRSAATPKASAPPPAPAPIIDLFGSDEPPTLAPAVTAAPTAAPAPTSAGAAAPAAQATAGTAPPGPTATARPQGSSIFDLDFRAPTPSSSASAKPQTAKADIMSLFASPPASAPAPQQSFFNATQTTSPPAQNSYASWGGGITSSAPPAQQHPTQTALPTAGGAGWGGLQMDQGGWGAPTAQAQSAPTAQNNSSNVWSTNAAAATATATAASPWADPWASTGNAGSNGFFGAAQPAQVQKKDDRDPFANIWG